MSENYFGGIPYAPDVKKIRTQYPENEMKIGQKISYEEISELIRENKKSKRFYNITKSWRMQIEKESGVFIQPIGDGSGLKVISESEKLDLANREDRTATKKSRRSLIVLKSIDPKELTDDERPMLNFKLEKIGRVLAIQQLRTQQALPEI